LAKDKAGKGGYSMSFARIIKEEEVIFVSVEQKRLTIQS
jgi:hypothetical protein